MDRVVARQSSDWLVANAQFSPDVEKKSIVVSVVGQWITKSFVPCSRRGLLAYVYSGVSLTRSITELP